MTAGLADQVTDSWMFLGVRFDVLTPIGAPVAVAEMLLPEGASPPAHLHHGLDDSFYLLEGTMVVRCGEKLSLARPGTWVQFPSGVVHTFRVIGGPARALTVHDDESFLELVRAVGHRRRDSDQPETAGGPSPEELDRILRAHGITTVGPPMELDEAEHYLRVLKAGSTSAG